MERVTEVGQPPPPTPISQLMRPFSRFMHDQASSGIVLVVVAVIALVWANSPWYHSYEELFETHITIGFGRWALNESLHYWINDALMAIFFFVVGLEIKRAVLVGELRSARKAALPIVAAFGGMIVPAILFISLNSSGDGSRGWGIPMATDIAFSLGVLSLLGTRVPLSLKIFLTAFAIIDDLGAVIIIAVFYTGDILWGNLGIGALFLGVLLGISALGIRHPLVYAVVGTIVWLAFLQSGIHATVAGVLVAATIPIRVRVNSDGFLARSRDLLMVFERSGNQEEEEQTSSTQRAIIQELEETVQQMESPLQRFEHALQPWVAFAIMPLFALANAGVRIEGDFLDALTHPVTIGIILGLVIGKQVGVTLFAWAAVRFGLAALPYGVTWRQMYGVAILGGIGFTMSLFITSLAFVDGGLNAEAKIGILLGSAISGVIGYLVLRTGGQSDEAAFGE
jgi:NhaA family Na+:H+ antiporter